MGLLRKAEQRRKELLEKLTKEKKKYIDHISKKRKKVIQEEIKKQRKEIIKQIKKKPLVVKKPEIKEPAKKFDISSVKQEIEAELKSKREEGAAELVKPKEISGDFIATGVPGFDSLFEHGIPKGSSVLVAGGAGSGKTIINLQILNYHASREKKCLYMSFEESEKNLVKHMEGFGWDPKELIKKKRLLIKRFNPFDITRSVDALLTKAKGELLIEVEPIIFPEGFKPEFIVVDSLTAISSAFTGKEDSYRIYIEQLFRFFEQIGSTSFLITETKQIPTVFSQTGVEEFLADGVIVLYNIKRGNIRENAIEVLKLRGAKHQKKIVAMQITDQGIIVYPEQEVFGGVKEEEELT